MEANLSWQVANLLETVKKQQETLDAYLRNEAERRQLRWQSFVLELGEIIDPPAPGSGPQRVSKHMDYSLFDYVRVCVTGGVGAMNYTPIMICDTPVGLTMILPKEMYGAPLWTPNGTLDGQTSFMATFEPPFYSARIGLMDITGVVLVAFTGKIFVIAGKYA